MILTHEIANYPGVESISGYKLASTMKKQAQSFGATIKTISAPPEISDEGTFKTVQAGDKKYSAYSVILAPGGAPRGRWVSRVSRNTKRRIVNGSPAPSRTLASRPSRALSSSGASTPHNSFMAAAPISGRRSARRWPSAVSARRTRRQSRRRSGHSNRQKCRNR